MNRFGPEEEAAVHDVISIGDISPYFRNPDGGKYVQQLEKEFAEYVGVDYAVAVSNGTSALHTAYLACGIRPGDRVAVPAHSFIATASMVLAVGALPVFYDVGLHSYVIGFNDLKYGTEHAVVPVDLLGLPCPMKEIYEYAHSRGPVIEDAAQALGSFVGGRHAGSQFNDCATWSFQQTKNLGIGEGGMVTTNDREIARKCKSIRSHGSGYLDDPGLTFNFRMTELAAAVGLVQLRKYPETLKQIMENGAYVLNHLPSGFTPQRTRPDIFSNMYILGCTVAPDFNRKQFVEQMKTIGVSKGLPGSVVSLGYDRCLYERPLFQFEAQVKIVSGWMKHPPCPHAEALCRTWVWLDIHRFKTLEETKEAVGAMHGALNDG